MKKKEIKIGTFNLNNLFGRWNFKASINKIKKSGTYSFDPKNKYWIRNFFGKLVEPKSEEETKRLAQRILESKVDILAIQEVEDRDTLRRFNKEYLHSRYSHKVVIDGNDPRLMDIGILSQYPFGAITSWQEYVYPKKSKETIFSRDLLQVEVLDKQTRKFLFTFFVTHLKSKFVSGKKLKGAKKQQQIIKDNKRRLNQSKAVVEIVSKEMKHTDHYIIVGDFNDIPDSKDLAPLVGERNKLKLEDIVERLPEEERWTYIFNKIQQQLDYILIPSSFLKKLKKVEVKIGRRRSSKDGSDHDPVFVILEF